MMSIHTENVKVVVNSNQLYYDVCISHKETDGEWHVERIELDLPSEVEPGLEPYQRVLYDIWCYSLAQNDITAPSSLSSFLSERDMPERDMPASDSM